MDPQSAFLALVAAVCAIAYLVVEGSLGLAGPFIKAIPVGVLALWVGQADAKPGKNLGAAGLGFSALADWVIEYNFLGGLGVFLVAHLFYIAAFVTVEPRWRLLRLVPMALWAALALPIVASGAGSLRVPVLVYGGVIFVMIWRAAATVTKPVLNRTLLFPAGAILFGVSDTLLAYNRFVAPLPAGDLLVLGTYWSAQTMIAKGFARRT